MAHITFLAYPNCSMAGISGSIDAFSIANLWCRLEKGIDETCVPKFFWDIVTMDGKPVEGRGRITIQPHGSIRDIENTDFILIPGFLPPLEFVGNVPAELTEWLRHWHERKRLIGTICTGAFLLAETGLLDGRIATTNWSFARHFEKCYPKIRLQPEKILTEDDGLICSGATTAFLDLCLHLIEKFGSSELAARCSKSLLMETNRRSQSPYEIFDRQKNHADKTILKAQAEMEKKFGNPISVDSLATNLGISPRHFKRRFKNATGDAPLNYLQRIRIEAAKRKLETTMETVDQITWQVGYEDSNSFRRLFKKNTGLSPREYRDRFARSNRRAL